MQNELFSRDARCNNRNLEAWEQLIFLKSKDNKLIIQSRWDGRNLQVQPNGRCVFANRNQLLWEKFEIESDNVGRVYFTSCHTGNVMTCNINNSAWCHGKRHGPEEAWTIVFPPNSKIITAGQVNIVGFAAAGAFLSPVLGLAAGALVPTAMATFGTVVKGVGTLHAPLVAGGCAAILQHASATLLTAKAVAVGAASGSVIGALANTPTNPNGSTGDTKRANLIESEREKGEGKT